MCPRNSSPHTASFTAASAHQRERTRTAFPRAPLRTLLRGLFGAIRTPAPLPHPSSLDTDVHKSLWLQMTPHLQMSPVLLSTICGLWSTLLAAVNTPWCFCVRPPSLAWVDSIRLSLRNCFFHSISQAPHTVCSPLLPSPCLSHAEASGSQLSLLGPSQGREEMAEQGARVGDRVGDSSWDLTLARAASSLHSQIHTS